jgi:hypothetical protein
MRVCDWGQGGGEGGNNTGEDNGCCSHQKVHDAALTARKHGQPKSEREHVTHHCPEPFLGQRTRSVRSTHTQPSRPGEPPAERTDWEAPWSLQGATTKTKRAASTRNTKVMGRCADCDKQRPKESKQPLPPPPPPQTGSIVPCNGEERSLQCAVYSVPYAACCCV